MTSSYTLRQLAQIDLEEIWLYSLEEWGITQADHYIRTLLIRFSWLAENPAIGKSRDDIKPGYYCFPEGSHLIFYTLTDYGIDVIGIPHQRMDVIGHLEE
ncbi:MAG: type II toxin-antitoxin system RelE/ParE family toxin [Methylococcales bacterium]|nr:type II toxin-antitoxin system RelE/ParE family toxin [Methylococcaceae bacterium]